MDSVLFNHELILIMLCVFVCGNMVRRFLLVSLIFDNQNNCCALCGSFSYAVNLLCVETVLIYVIYCLLNLAGFFVSSLLMEHV